MTQNSDVIASLDDWDAAVCANYFSDEFDGQEVYLSIDCDVIDGLIPDHSLSHLLEAVESECDQLPAGSRNPLYLSRERLRAWSRLGTADQQPPPVFGIAAVLICAATYGDEEFAPNDYWHRLQELRESLGASVEDLSESHRNYVEGIFDALRSWSCERMRGTHGRFIPRVLGGMRRVGMIRAQALLSPRDRAALDRAFALHSLSPYDDVSDAELIRAARTVQNSFRPTVRRLLNKWPADLANGLAALIEKCLRDWDGSYEDESGSRAQRPRDASLELQLRRVGAQLMPVMRVVASHEDVPDEVSFVGPSDEALVARFDFGDKSEPLELDGCEELFDATSVDWTRSLRLAADVANGAVPGALLKGRDLRFFINDGFSWNETAMLPPTGTCLIAHTDETREALEKWCDTAVGRSQWLSIDLYLPERWQCLRLKAIPTDPSVRKAFPQAGRTAAENPTLIRLGGVADSVGDYFPFALPTIQIRGFSDGAALHLRSIYGTDGLDVAREFLALYSSVTDTTTWHLELDPYVWNTASSIELDVVSENTVVDTLRLRISTLPASHDSPGCPRDVWGRQTTRQAPIFVDGQQVVPAYSGDVTDPARPLGPPQNHSVERSSERARLISVLAGVRRLSWSRAKRVAASLAYKSSDALDWKMSRSITLQFDALRALGHLEITESADGFFEHVVALPRQVNMLPSRANAGFFPGGSIALAHPVQAVATGTYSERDILSLIDAARKSGVSCHIARQPMQCWLLPDRVCLQASEASQIASACLRAGWAYSSVPFVTSLKSAMPRLCDFCSIAEWRPGPPPSYEMMRVFDPQLCRTVHIDEVNDPLLACECPASDVSRRMTYWLFDRQTNRSAPCPRQLARWIVRLSSDQLAKVLPVLSTGELLCPVELRPPLVIERLICSCSGLAPAILMCTKPSSIDWPGIGLPAVPKTIPQWITGSHVYSGHLLAYGQFAVSPLRTNEEGKQQFRQLGVDLERVSSMYLCELGEDQS